MIPGRPGGRRPFQPVRTQQRGREVSPTHRELLESGDVCSGPASQCAWSLEGVEWFHGVKRALAVGGTQKSEE